MEVDPVTTTTTTTTTPARVLTIPLRRRCYFFGHLPGCRNGDACPYVHDSVTPLPPKTTNKEKRARRRANEQAAREAGLEPMPYRNPSKRQRQRDKRQTQEGKLVYRTVYGDNAGDDYNVAGSGDGLSQATTVMGPAYTDHRSHRRKYYCDVQMHRAKMSPFCAMNTRVVRRPPLCWFYMNSLCVLGPFCDYFHPYAAMNPYALPVF